jgi:hypothetical protein
LAAFDAVETSNFGETQLNLMTLVRLLVLVVVGWTVVALGAGVLGVGANDHATPTFYVPNPSLVDAVTLGRLDRPSSAQHRLIDRTTGHVEPLLLPAEQTWSLLSVSPWRDQHGLPEAVGRWARLVDGEEAFCGLGLLKLPGGTLANCLTLEILPTGKPCWVPGQAGAILFPAGDGQLYRCNIASDGKNDRKSALQGTSPGDRGNVVVPRAVTWDNKPPGFGNVYLCDPVWSAEPALRNFVFVALSEQKCVANTRKNSVFKLWWLLMNDEGDTIVSAGRLTRPGQDEEKNDTRSERMPTVAVGSRGEFGLVYLAREPDAVSWQLRMVKLEIDHARRSVGIQPEREADTVFADGLAVAALVVSADAKSVHAIDISGAHCEHSIAR